MVEITSNVFTMLDTQLELFLYDTTGNEYIT